MLRSTRAPEGGAERHVSPSRHRLGRSPRLLDHLIRLPAGPRAPCDSFSSGATARCRLPSRSPGAPPPRLTQARGPRNPRRRSGGKRRPAPTRGGPTRPLRNHVIQGLDPPGAYRRGTLRRTRDKHGSARWPRPLLRLRSPARCPPVPRSSGGRGPRESPGGTIEMYGLAWGSCRFQVK
jgi:hypothetical protein